MIILRQKEYTVSQQTFQKVQSLKQQYPNIGSRIAFNAIKKNSEGILGSINLVKGNMNKGIHATKKQLSGMSGFKNVGVFENQPKVLSESKNFSKVGKILKNAKKVDVGIFRKDRPEIEWIKASTSRKPIEPVKPVLTWYN